MKHPGKGVGARLPRKEDARFLRGQGQYVGNIRMVGIAKGGPAAAAPGGEPHIDKNA